MKITGNDIIFGKISRRLASAFRRGDLPPRLIESIFAAWLGRARHLWQLPRILLGAGFLAALTCPCLFSASPVMADRVYAPEYLWQRKIAEKTDPVGIADTHLGIAYRDDGTLDAEGRFTTFAHPEVLFETPGLNCSGLVVSVSRFLFDKNWSLQEVSRDRRGDSGPGSSLGRDWDFGWDLIRNLTETVPRRVVLPDRRDYDPDQIDGLSLRGFSLLDQAAWQNVLGQMRPGYVYLGSISKDSRRPGYKVLHYHVVLMIPDPKGSVWLYHATHRSNVHRIDMNSRQGLRRFMSQFSGGRDEPKQMIVIEAKLPQLEPATETAGEPDPATTTGASRGSAQPLSAPGQPAADTAAAGPVPGSGGALQGGEQSGPVSPVSPKAPQQAAAPSLVITHLWGKVFAARPELNTQVPRFADDSREQVKFWFRNFGDQPRDLELLMKGPEGESHFQGRLQPDGRDTAVLYPRDFGPKRPRSLTSGKYVADARIDGQRWVADAFEIGLPREAAPKITAIAVPTTVKAGSTFAVKVEAENQGAESDYGGITVSCPDPGLRIKAANPGKVFAPGSTVLSVTTDRVRTKVPMAERWIELWGEGVKNDITVTIQAGKPGTYPIYVRSTLRGVNVKSSVVLMDPATSDKVDQQGFPVHVRLITVQ
ncbi:MAG: hypothetical protein HY914_04575 [Desulfomonile tiedjei]|nr:hypothetical protein [Desulfomonile tiedjei]